MEKRKLGKSGLETGKLVLGGNVFGWTLKEPLASKLLDAFLDSGLNMIDTADVYSKWIPGNKGGDSEEVLGGWLKKSGRRKQVLIATKCGIEMDPGDGGLSRAYIMKAVDRSLKRLQTDYIDLYQAHRDDENTPLEETLSAYAELIKQGKVRAIGGSNYTAKRLAEVLKVAKDNDLPRYETMQPWYNMYDRKDFEGELQDLCVKEDIGVIPYFALASGFLSGKYRKPEDAEGKPRGYRTKDMINERGLKILGALDKVAAETKSNPAQVALAWLMAQPSITAPIASATSLDQLKDLVAATTLELSPAQIKDLSDASAY